MLHQYARHLYRDRRRLAVGFGLLGFESYVSNNTLPDMSPYVSTEFVLSFLTLIVIPLVTLYLPRHRHWIEIYLVAAVISMSIGWLLPSSAFSLTGPYAFTPIALAAFVADMILTRYLLYGRWSDRFTPSRAVTLHSRMHSTASLKELWYGLVPVPGHLDKYCDHEVVSIDYVDADHRAVRVIRWPPDEDRVETVFHFEDVVPLRHMLMHAEVIEGVMDPAWTGTSELTLRDAGRRRVIDFRYEVASVAPRRMLRGWLDDTPGRIFDDRIQSIEGHGKHVAAGYAAWFVDVDNVDRPREAPRHLSAATPPAAEAPAEPAAAPERKPARSVA